MGIKTKLGIGFSVLALIMSFSLGRHYSNRADEISRQNPAVVRMDNLTRGLRNGTLTPEEAIEFQRYVGDSKIFGAYSDRQRNKRYEGLSVVCGLSGALVPVIIGAGCFYYRTSRLIREREDREQKEGLC